MTKMAATTIKTYIVKNPNPSKIILRTKRPMILGIDNVAKVAWAPPILSKVDLDLCSIVRSNLMPNPFIWDLLYKDCSKEVLG